MRILLDEGIPRRLATLLKETRFDAVALPAEWRGATDATLMDWAEREGFTILITQDRNMPFQRPLSERALKVLIVPQLDRREVLARLGVIRERLPMLEPGRYALLETECSLPLNPSKPLRG